MKIWRTGDHVSITCDGRTVDGRIALASSNGQSLVLTFDAILATHVQIMPVLLDDDRLFRSLMPPHVEVTIAEPAIRPPAYPDCALPNRCACAARGYPKPHKSKCLVPAINAFARGLEWKVPYPEVACEDTKAMVISAPQPDGSIRRYPMTPDQVIAYTRHEPIVLTVEQIRWLEGGMRDST